MQGVLRETKISTYPRKGTETGHTGHTSNNITISTYPRKGTETPAFGKVDPAVMDFNLSPQGDGNGILHGTLLQSGQIQLIPARGRKLEYARVKNNLLVFQLIPVKTLSGAARRLSRRESFSGCHLPCTKLPLSGELARRKP